MLPKSDDRSSHQPRGSRRKCDRGPIQCGHLSYDRRWFNRAKTSPALQTVLEAFPNLTLDERFVVLQQLEIRGQTAGVIRAD